jgi:hypothetical protein
MMARLAWRSETLRKHKKPLASSVATVRVTLLVLASAVGLLGCIAVPIPQDHFHGRVAAVDALTIKTGETTQEDILLHMGDPDVILLDERVFVYQWEHVKWGVLWIVGTYGGGASGVIEVPTHEMFLVQFDDMSRVKRADHAVRPRDAALGDFLKSWAEGEASANP